MEVSSKHQFLVFLLCVISGMGCGIVFDVQRLIRKVFSAGKIRTAVEDLMFGTICTVITIAIGYLYNRGEIRYYQVLGAAFGITFYAAFFSHITTKIIKRMNSFTRQFVLLPMFSIVKLIFAPLIKIFYLVRGVAERKKRKILKCCSALSKKRKKFKKRMKML